LLAQTVVADNAGRLSEAPVSDDTEIVVTAQKSGEQRLSDVPISISVLSGEDLDSSSFQGVREALESVPGVYTSASQNDTTDISVRGVTALNAYESGSSIVGYYLDATPFSLIKRAIVPDTAAYDLQRVEVLRGPQGTLYGASALNGVVRVLTNDANLDKFELKGRTFIASTRGGDESYRGDAAVSVPLVPGKLAVRAVVGYQDNGGWIDRPNLNQKNANGSENKTLRVKINAQPTEQFTIGASAWLSRIERGAASTADSSGTSGSLAPESNSDDFDSYGLTMAYQFPHFELSSATTYLKSRFTGNLDLRPFGLPTVVGTFIDGEMFAEELLLHSEGKRSFQWSIGFMYRSVNENFSQTLPELLGPTPFSDDANTSRSIAVFGEITKSFFDYRLELTAGVRYFHDKVGFVSGVTPVTDFGHKTFESVNPRLVLKWKATEDVNFYASYAEGFRSGAFQGTGGSTQGVAPTEPDTLHNYEIGTKGTLFDKLLTFDASVYFIDWQDPQFNRTIFVTVGGISTPTGGLFNSESVSGFGTDLGVSLRPVRGLTLSGAFSWNDLAVDADTFDGTRLFYAKGDRIDNSPEYTANASLNYVFPLGGHGLEGEFSGSVNYISKRKVTFADPLSSNTSATLLSDDIMIARGSFTLHAPKNWSATLFVDNITNEQGVTRPYGGLSPRYWDARSRPRTFGFQIEYRY
jgi:outer membrane receptor protein involved in Fe transport